MTIELSSSTRAISSTRTLFDTFMLFLCVVVTMSDDNSLAEGQRVYDVETSVYTVVEVLDEQADDVIAREEVKERGHVIYEERTVADQNPNYPVDDTVVRLERAGDGAEMLWPISRVVEEVDAAIDK